MGGPAAFHDHVVFSIFFGALAKIPSDGMPYPIFAFAALVPWTFFANSVSAASASLVGNAALVTKIYFPRLVVPLAGVIATFVDFLCGLVVFAGVAMYFGQRPSAQLVFLPLFILLTMATALGVGLWLAALNVRYRDVRYIVPYVLQFWFFATPVAYPSSLVPEPWRLWYAINPMVGVIDGFRAALVSGPAIRPGSLVISAITSAIMLAGGVLYFRRIERTLADIV